MITRFTKSYLNNNINMMQQIVRSKATSKVLFILLFISILYLISLLGPTIPIEGNTSDTQRQVTENPVIKLHYNQNGICTKGDIGLTRDSSIQDEFKQFLEVYKKKPGDNAYGTKLAHQFALWTMVRQLKPLHIIESGIYKGFGTWMLRQAAPQAQLIMLDPSGAVTYRDMHEDSKYFTGPTFKDFADMDWKSLNIDVSKTLIFFDDHQSNIKRVIQAQKAGFRHIMFDDNASFQQGFDCLSMNAACDINLGKVDVFQQHFVYKDNFNRVSRPFESEDVDEVKKTFDTIVEAYFEFPFPWKHEKTKNVWFPEWEKTDVINNYGLSESMTNNEYFNICYVLLKKQ